MPIVPQPFLRLVRFSLLALLSVAGGAVSVYAQSVRAGGVAGATIGMERLSDEAAADRLEAFRNQRPRGDYRFEFELAHKPVDSSRTVRFDGTMWGAWEEAGPVSRIRLNPEPGNVEPSGGDSEEAVELIVRSGADASSWVRSPDSRAFRRMSAEEALAPVVEGVLHRPFDLQMPFLFWRDFEYRGPGRIGARAVVQYFDLFSPEGSAAADVGIHAVRLAIDDDYGSLKRVEVLDESEAVTTEFTVEGIRKVDGRYIPSRISLKDTQSGERTIFRVKEAEVGMRHDASWFDPEALSTPLRPTETAD